MSTDTRDEQAHKLPAEVWVLIAANAVIALGYGVVAPVLPDYARHFGVSVSAATFIITAFALMRLIFAPAAGELVQRLGERHVYVSGLLIVLPVTSRPTSTPISDSGSAAMMAKGCANEPNCDARTM